MTLEQQQALALARARRRRAEAGDPVTPPGVIPSDPSLKGPPVTPEGPSFGRRVRDVVGPTVEGLGAIGGAALGTAAMGPIVGTGVGAGLGYGIGKGALRLIDQAAGWENPPENALSAVKTGAEDVATGALMERGGALAGNALAKGGAWVAGRFRNARDLIAPGGASNILDRYTRTKVGDRHLPDLISAARNADELLPGGLPTLSQATAGVPSGSPLAAMEAVAARTPGGISADFGARKVAQKQAIDNALAARKAASDINYGKAFDPALHKLKPDAELLLMQQNPYFQSALPTAEKVAAAKNLNATDNLTEILHNVKMGLDKKLKPGFGEVGIDNAERGAILDLKQNLTKWLVKKNSDYAVGRAEHETASKAIKAFTDRQELALNPLQQTSLSGGKNIAEETRPHLPQMLTRPMMIANAVLSAAGKNVEKEIDALAALRHLDPKVFADAMEKVVAASSRAQQGSIRQALIAMRNSPGATAASINALSGIGQ